MATHTSSACSVSPTSKKAKTAEKRDGMRSFLQRRQYRIGRATIDASHWAISWRLEKRLDGAPKSRHHSLWRVFQAAHLGPGSVFRSSCSPGAQPSSAAHHLVAPQRAQRVVLG